MSKDYSNFSLNKGKSGKIDLTNLKGGFKREQIKDEKLLAIFDALDNGNNILEDKEVANLKSMLQEYAKNTNLSNREAKKFIDALFKGNDTTVTKEDLFSFLGNINNNSQNIKNSTTFEDNGNKIIQTEYNDGTIEQYNQNEEKTTIIKDNQTSIYDKNNNIISQEYFDNDGNAIKTVYENNKPKKTVKTLANNNGTETINYEDGTAKTRVVQNSTGSETYQITSNGEQLTQKVENGTSPADKKITQYQYNEDGTVTETTTQGTTTITTVKQGNEVQSTHKLQQNEDGISTETIVDENGNRTENTYNKDGNKLRQTKTINEETYQVEYDGEGNTIIIVQNGESINAIAKKFGITPEEIEKLNEEKIKTKGNSKYFIVGEEIKIPGELEADDMALRGRKSKEETIADYTKDAIEREQKEEEDKRLRDEAANRKTITFTAGQKTFEALAKQLFKQEGNENPSDREMQLRVEELKKHNPNIKNGELQGKKVIAGVSDETYNRITNRQKEIKEINKKIRINKEAKDIAENLYKACDDNAAAVGKQAFQSQLNRITEENIIQVLDNYEKVIEKNAGDSSLIDTICSEVGSSSANRQKALNFILDKMTIAAKKAGVKESDINHARTEFLKSMKEEFSSFGRINPSGMEKALDFLRGSTVSTKVSKDSPEVSTAEAMNTFVNEKDSGLVDNNMEAQKTYKDAREAEGWAAKTGDWVCGLFGCTTIDDMDKKLGTHAADVKKLAEAAEKKDEAGFKKLYKEIFGIEFDPKKVQARQTARENLEAATAFDSSYKVFSGLEKKTQNMNYSEMKSELKKAFGYQDAEIDELISAYAQNKGLESTSDSDKKFVLDTFIRESKQTYQREYHKIANGKTLDQMTKDVDLLTKSAYGTNDIVKDVIKFNENQQLTDTITTAAFEIAGTVALQFVPGLGQLAAARLAVSAAKWGAKGIKIANMANKAYKAAATVTKLQNANKKAQIATQIINTGIATAAVNLSDKKSVEETMRKTLMNMSFAGVGVSSSILAPKLMQSFGITNKALANEIAEEILNMAGSYGVTKVAGDNYGETDAFIDFASGLLISRLSHIKTNKPTVEADIPAPAPKPNDTPTPSPNGTNKPEPPTPGKPSKITFFEDSNSLDFEVIKTETNKQGQKTLHATDGTKITLDTNDRPILIKNKSGDTTVYEYNSGNSTTPSKSTVKNKKNQIKSTSELKNDVQVEKNFETGKEQILDKNNNVITERYISLSEYPAGAKIPEPDVYSANLKKQIEECTSPDKLNELKYEYDMYNAKFGQTEDLYSTFANKNVELEGTPTITPQKPKSKLITDTAFDSNLQNLNLKKYGKQGIPLKYSHDNFMKDLKKQLDSLPENERNAVMADLNIKFQQEGSKFELVDIPNLSAKAKTDAHKNVLDILNKYAKQNEIQLPDPIMNSELQKFIKDVPEFTFMIGKPQNGVHSYSLDSHTLQNLQKALKYADEANLAQESKEILKMSILLHDMGKQFKGSGVSDTGHSVLSKKYAEKILERFDYPQSTKDKILNLIENHHWFKEFNKGNMSADDVVKMFGDNLPLAKVMAKADLESVSDDFHLTILEPGKKLSQAEYNQKINEKLNNIDNVITAELLGHELPIGAIGTYKPYILDLSKVDQLKLGNVTIDMNDPKLKDLINNLKEGESFAIGCTNPKTHYPDVKYQIGKHEDGIASHHIIISKKHGELVIEAHKDVTIVKDIPTAKNSDPVISKKIDELRKKATSITTETFTINGKQVQFEILNGTQGGSNKGYYVINKESGELFYAKFGGAQGKTELLATKLYEMAGLDVPEMNSFKAADGTNGTLSKYIPELSKVTQVTAKANEGFGMDVLLANWDVVGLANDNMLKTPDGKIIRLDAGGTFDYRAQGANKPYTSIPTEITTLLDPHINAKSAEIFSQMTREDMIKSLNKAVSLKDSAITQLLDDMGLTQYKEALLKRKKFLKSMLEEIKATPQGKKSMLDYMTDIKHAAFDKAIASTKSLEDLIDIKQALQFTTDKKIKENLLNKIDAKEKYLKALNPTPKVQKLSAVQVNNLLVKNNFVQDSYGNYTKKLDDATKQQYHNAYGSYGSSIISKIEKPLTPVDIQKITKMINMDGGKYIGLWQKDMNALIQLYRNIENSNIFGLNNLTPAHWNAVFNIAQTKPITADQIGSLAFYKGSGYMDINNGLTDLKKHNIPLNPSIKQKIDNVQAYLNTQVIKEPIKVYRKEGPEVLASVKLPNGQTLDKAMAEAVAHFNQTGDTTLIEKVKNMVKKGNLTATQERFMSTSFNPNVWSGSIHWELNVPKGAKGVFLEGVNVKGHNQGECEFLLQKDSNINIIDIDFKNGHWVLKGSVSN